MKKPKSIFIWGPDLKPPRTGNYRAHYVELLRGRLGKDYDKQWVEYRLVRKKKKK